MLILCLIMTASSFPASISVERVCDEHLIVVPVCAVEYVIKYKRSLSENVQASKLCLSDCIFFPLNVTSTESKMQNMKRRFNKRITRVLH